MVTHSEISLLSEDKNQGRVYRFGIFELDCATGDLRKDGKSRPRIRDQALQILILLLEKSEEVVGREELRDRVWPSDTFVDFDHGLNTAINQVRTALGDSAANPKFIQTLPRKGYRFIAPVQIVARDGAVAGGAESRRTVSGESEAAAGVLMSKAGIRASVLSDAQDLPVVRKESVRILFSLIQLMYLIFYIIFLARLSFAEAVLNNWGRQAFTVLMFLVVTAAIGIPVRLYLLTAMAFRYEGLNEKFKMLFPFLLVLDEIWALTPFLCVEQIGMGVAIAVAAALLYLPFSQRTLLLMGFRVRS